MSERLSAEEWLKQLDATVKTYREAASVGPASAAAARGEALAKMRALGLSDSESARYLDGKPKGHR